MPKVAAMAIPVLKIPSVMTVARTSWPRETLGDLSWSIVEWSPP